MDRIRLSGNGPLTGTIPISGAKNAALPLMIASLLSDQTLVLENVPRLRDVRQLTALLTDLGVDFTAVDVFEEVFEAGTAAGQQHGDSQGAGSSALRHRKRLA